MSLVLYGKLQRVHANACGATRALETARRLMAGHSEDHMRKWINLAVLLAGGIVLASCASNISTKATVGFVHQELTNELDFTGENSGYQIGGTLGFEFGVDGLAAVEPCVLGSYVFGKTTVGDDLKATTNLIPGSLCVEIGVE